MIEIKAEWDMRDLVQRMRATNKALDRALPRAVNKVATSAKTQAAREIRAEGYKLKVGTIKKAISLSKATRSRPVAYVKAKGKPVNLIEYGARFTRARGVTVTVKGPRKRVGGGAFVATMPTGKKLVLVRKPQTRPRIKAERYAELPIRALPGPSVPAMFGNDRVLGALVRKVKERLPVVMRQELAFEMSKVRK